MEKEGNRGYTTGLIVCEEVKEVLFSVDGWMDGLVRGHGEVCPRDIGSAPRPVEGRRKSLVGDHGENLECKEIQT